MKEEALKLANELANEKSERWITRQEASAMIRRLVEELNCAEDYIKQYQLQTKPLSDEEMMKVIEQVACSYNPYEIEMSYDYEIRVARAIEERHGIK